MSKKYRGKGCVSRITPPGAEENCYLQVKMYPADIHFFTNVMEAYKKLPPAP